MIMLDFACYVYLIDFQYVNYQYYLLCCVICCQKKSYFFIWLTVVDNKFVYLHVEIGAKIQQKNNILNGYIEILFEQQAWC